MEVIFMNFRELNKDILKDWFDYREQEVFCELTPEDKKHPIKYDEICKKILNSIPKQNRKFVDMQLGLLDENFTDYLLYWNEKYYRNGFCDGIMLMKGCGEK